MIVKKEQLKPYLHIKADLIPLFKWNKVKKSTTGETITNKVGKPVPMGKAPIHKNWSIANIDVNNTLKYVKEGNNVGYRIPEGEIIIDDDPRNYKDGVNSLQKLLSFLGIKDLAEYCPTVITGSGGHHYYLKHPTGANIRHEIPEFPGIEFKTKGTQIVCAGSKHPNGNYYEWDDFAPTLGEQPKLPKKLLKILKYKPIKNTNPAGTITNIQLHRLLTQLPITDYAEYVDWFKIICASHHATGGTGISEAIAWSAGNPEYATWSDAVSKTWHALHEKETMITDRTLYDEVMKNGGSIKVATASEDFNDYIDSTSNKEPKENIATKRADALALDSSDEDIIKAIRAALHTDAINRARALETIRKTLGWQKGRLNDVVKQVKEHIVLDIGRELAEKTLVDKFHNKNGLVFAENGQFWMYNGEFWRTVHQKYVGQKITETLDEMRCSTDIDVKEDTLVNESLSIIGRLAATCDDVLRMREMPYAVINCKNGELWINDAGEVKLKRHHYKSYLLQIIETDYEPDAQCPIFDKAIRGTFSDFEDTEDLVRHFEEFMGYVLYPRKQPAKWWLLNGPGGDGKTTLMLILCALLKNAMLPESIDKFKNGQSGDNHASANLVGKLLVYDDDLDANMLLPDGVLKKLSEDGESTANPKGYPAFRFTRVCTVAMLSNAYPKTKDLSEGFRRRAAVIPFSRGFHNDSDMIRGLGDKIINAELSGVLNRALQGLQRVRERGDFKEPLSCEIAKETWLAESNTIALFKRDCIQIDDTHNTLLGNVYIRYTRWCAQHGIIRVHTKQRLRSDLEALGLNYGKLAGNKNGFYKIKLAAEVCEDFEIDEKFDDNFFKND